MGRAIRNYADHESHNTTTKVALKDFTENLFGVQDFREIQVRRAIFLKLFLKIKT